MSGPNETPANFIIKKHNSVPHAWYGYYQYHLEKTIQTKEQATNSEDFFDFQSTESKIISFEDDPIRQNGKTFDHLKMYVWKHHSVDELHVLLFLDTERIRLGKYYFHMAAQLVNVQNPEKTFTKTLNICFVNQSQTSYFEFPVSWKDIDSFLDINNNILFNFYIQYIPQKPKIQNIPTLKGVMERKKSELFNYPFIEFSKERTGIAGVLNLKSEYSKNNTALRYLFYFLLMIPEFQIKLCLMRNLPDAKSPFREFHEVFYKFFSFNPENNRFLPREPLDLSNLISAYGSDITVKTLIDQIQNDFKPLCDDKDYFDVLELELPIIIRKESDIELTQPTKEEFQGKIENTLSKTPKFLIIDCPSPSVLPKHFSSLTIHTTGYELVAAIQVTNNNNNLDYYLTFRYPNCKQCIDNELIYSVSNQNVFTIKKYATGETLVFSNCKCLIYGPKFQIPATPIFRKKMYETWLNQFKDLFNNDIKVFTREDILNKSIFEDATVTCLNKIIDENNKFEDINKLMSSDEFKQGSLYSYDGEKLTYIQKPNTPSNIRYVFFDNRFFNSDEVILFLKCYFYTSLNKWPLITIDICRFKKSCTINDVKNQFYQSINKYFVNPDNFPWSIYIQKFKTADRLEVSDDTTLETLLNEEKISYGASFIFSYSIDSSPKKDFPEDTDKTIQKCLKIFKDLNSINDRNDTIFQAGFANADFFLDFININTIEKELAEEKTLHLPRSSSSDFISTFSDYVKNQK